MKDRKLSSYFLSIMKKKLQKPILLCCENSSMTLKISSRRTTLISGCVNNACHRFNYLFEMNYCVSRSAKRHEKNAILFALALETWQ